MFVISIASISAAFHTLLFLCRENRFCERNISSAFLIGHDSSTIIKEQTDPKRYFCLKSHLWSFQPQFPDSPFGQHMFLSSSQFAIKIDRKCNKYLKLICFLCVSRNATRKT